MTSVDLIRAAAIWRFLSRNSRTASAVMMEVMCCPPTESVTCAKQATGLNVSNAADQLVAATDAAEGAAAFLGSAFNMERASRGRSPIRGCDGGRRGLDALEACPDRSTASGCVADSEHLGRVAWSVELRH